MNPITTILKTIILAYQKLISPLLPHVCRFYPSCSIYALAALEGYGPVKGLAMALGRICRCHPWNPGGYDPVMKTK
jgi:hypothetical protein